MREHLAYEAAVPLSQINTLGSNDLPRLQDITSIYALLALQDHYSGNSTWLNSTGTDNLQAYIKKNGLYGIGQQLYSDVSYWGLTFFYSYRTYKEQFLLDYAVNAWNTIYSDAFITPDDAADGERSGRNVSFLPPAHCATDAFAGGVFVHEDEPNNVDVNTESIGPFMTLSAYLYEETKNITYQQATQLSLDFMISYLWNGTIVLDTITLDTCQIGASTLTLNQAWFVEGLAVWANVTQNHTLTTLLETAIPTITTFPVWSLQSGVVNEPDSTASADRILKGLYIRGLAEARMWIGAESYDASGNIAALDVLNAAFSFIPSMSSAGSSSTSSPSPTSIAIHSKSSSTGAIAGGVVGGVVAAVAAITVVLLCRRRRRPGAIDILNENDDDNARRMHSVEPFTSRPAYNLTASKAERVNFEAQHGAPSLAVSPPESAPEPTHHQGLDQEATGIPELPSLIQRLNNLLQGRQGELPPRYDD